MAVHLVGLPHTPFDENAASTCAYTAKSVRLAKMLASVGEEVIVYWGGSKTRAQKGPWEYVPALTNAQQKKYFGDFSQQVLPVANFDAGEEYWQKMNDRVIKEISKRIQPGDFVALVAGHTQQTVANAFFAQAIVIEPEVGYSGIMTQGTFACFESYAWMHNVYGMAGIEDGRYYDTVIPNFQTPSDFEIGEDEGYALYLGRMVTRKGIQEAAQMAGKAGVPIIMAGAGATQVAPGVVESLDGVRIEGDHVTYVGAVDPPERKRLLSHARVLLAPTRYIEPFGTVHIEAMMSGVPVIAPDYGVFTETIINGGNGWRIRMERDGVQAIQAAEILRKNSESIRHYAIENFGVDVCAIRYKEWLDRLRTLWTPEGWYAP